MGGIPQGNIARFHLEEPSVRLIILRGPGN